MHGACLSEATLRDLGWRWPLGRDVVLKVQHDDMRCLMDSDVRNLGRLAAFVRDSMPFDAMPVRPTLLPLAPDKPHSYLVRMNPGQLYVHDQPALIASIMRMLP